MKITSIAKFGVAALAMGAFSGVGLPVRADQLVWGRAQQLDYWRARGLVPPGSYSQSENQKPATIAVSRAEQEVLGNRNRQLLKLQKRAHSASALHTTSHKSRSFGGAWPREANLKKRATGAENEASAPL
jgi:hypothetical protein